MKFDSPLKKQIKIAPAGVMENPNFREWFAKSAVVNSDGTPMRLYHGTYTSFDVFEPGHRGLFGAGIYLTNSRSDAMNYTDGKPMELYARIERPFVTQADYDLGDEFGLDYPGMPMIKELFPDRIRKMVEKILQDHDWLPQEIARKIASLGHDGLQVQWKDGTQQFIAFQSTQIKSATANCGNFSMLKASIYE